MIHNILTQSMIRPRIKILVNKAKKDSNWDVYPQTAIGSFKGKIDINISKNLYSSSILPINESHIEVDPDSAYYDTEKVDIDKLDNILNNMNSNSDFFLKIDTQGYEWEVLKGYENIDSAKNCRGIICELSIDKLYQGQKSWLEMIKFLESKNFKLWSIYPGFADLKINKHLQIDAIFINEKNSE